MPTTSSPTAAAPPELREVRDPAALAAAVRALGDAPRACLVCGAPDPRRAFERFGKVHWRCTACRLVWVHDIYPEFLVDSPPDQVLGVFLASGERSGNARRWPAMFAEFERHRGAGRLLDVGCGAGFLVQEAERRGWSGHGVEAQAVLAAHARDAFGLDVVTGELAEAGFEDGGFDVVHLNEVIEHVVDPVGLLREMHRVLRPGGLAWLRTGSVESWSARWRGAAWPYYAFGPGGHIRFYGPTSARALGRAAGFAEVHTTTTGFAFRENGELKGRWYRPLVRAAQAPVSTLATLCDAGHRLTMRFVKAGG